MVQEARQTLEHIKQEINKLTTNAKGMNLKELQEWKEKLNALYAQYNSIVGEEYYTTYKNI